MRFLCICVNQNSESVRLLRQACVNRSVEFLLIDPNSVDPDFKVEAGDMMYRVSDIKHQFVVELENHLLNKNVSVLYDNSDYLRALVDVYDDMFFEKYKVPSPKTFTVIPKNRLYIRKIVNELGGYPIIVKVLGASHGVGVMRADSYASLCSMVDYLTSTGARFVLKEYISGGKSARLIVLGKKVIGSIEYVANEGDFRSNEGSDPNVKLATFSKEVDKIAIKAVHSLGLEFGGVDILMSERGPLVAEVNFPCYFPRVQHLTGIDIAGMMVDYLIEKSKRLS